MSDQYYQIQAAIVEAAATLAAGMPEPTQSDVHEAPGRTGKDKLMNLYEERFTEMYTRLTKQLYKVMPAFPDPPPEK